MSFLLRARSTLFCAFAPKPGPRFDFRVTGIRCIEAAVSYLRCAKLVIYLASSPLFSNLAMEAVLAGFLCSRGRFDSILIKLAQQVLTLGTAWVVVVVVDLVVKKLPAFTIFLTIRRRGYYFHASCNYSHMTRSVSENKCRRDS